MAKYTYALISYFDVLGFADLVRTRSAGHIKGVLDTLRQTSAPDPELAKMYSTTYFNFSDHVVRVTNLLAAANVKEPSGLLFHELFSIVHMQANLIASGVLVRGSLTVGRLYARGRLIFGPGLNRAHELESTIAKYPRVVVDPVVLRVFEKTPLLKAAWHSQGDERPYLRCYLGKDVDGQWFTNYIRAMGIEMDRGEEFIAFIVRHRNLIQQRRRQFRGAMDILAKYNWLRRYHNSAVDKLGKSFLDGHGVRLAVLRVPVGAR